MTQHIEIIRENLTTGEVMAIRQQERALGRLVNIDRLYSNLVEITIIHPSHAIDITPRAIDSRRGRAELMAT